MAILQFPNVMPFELQSHPSAAAIMPEFIPMTTPHSLFINSSKVDKKQVAESFNRWSKELCPAQLNKNINEAITQKWNDVKENSVAVQKEISTALTEYRREVKKWQDPTKKMAPSLSEAMDALMFSNRRGIILNDSTKNFIYVGLHLKKVVEQLTAMDQLLSHFKCFDLLREKYSKQLEKIRKLSTEYSPIAHQHSSIKRPSLERSYILLLSVVPTMLDIIEIIVATICNEIPNAEMTDEEVDNWAKMEKNNFCKEQTVHFKLEIKTEVESYLTDQTDEIMRLRTLLANQIEENKKLQLTLKEHDLPIKERCDFESNEPIDEFDKLLRDCRQRAEHSDMKTKLETNYSTSNFAYGVFDSRGGNLSVGDVKLFIPKGAISSTQEVYIYIDPKARFSTENQDRNANEQVETRVAPIVHCGPPGTSFLNHVVLTFPHNAADEEQWKFTAVRAEGDRSSDDWQNIEGNESDDDSIVSVDGGFCMFMVKHFTRFTLMQNSPDR